MIKSILNFYVGLLAEDGSGIVTSQIESNEWSGFYNRFDEWNKDLEDNRACELIDPTPSWKVYGNSQAWSHAREYLKNNPEYSGRLVIVRTETFIKNWESFSSYIVVTGS